MDHIQSTQVRDHEPYTFNVAVGSTFAQMLGCINSTRSSHVPLTIGASLAAPSQTLRSRGTDLHLNFLPFCGEKGWDLAKQSEFRLGMYQNRPESRGRLRVTSPDPKANLSIVFNHLTAPNDVRTLMDGMKLAKRIAAAVPLKPFGVQELAPGPQGDTDQALLEYIRTTADTGFHFCGTARMGCRRQAVVDPQSSACTV